MNRQPRLMFVALLAATSLVSLSTSCSGGDRAHDKTQHVAAAENAGGKWYPVTGTVNIIDRGRGLVSLKTVPATLRLRFPSETVRNVKDGDTIIAQFTFAKTGTEHGLRAYDAPRQAPIGVVGQELGHERMNGMVIDIDHEKGVFNLETGAETLTVYFPPSAIRDLKTGDTITLQAVFLRATPLG